LHVAEIEQQALDSTNPHSYTISFNHDDQAISKIATEYQKGRLLVIQTTDLDTGQTVLLNIRAIAASGNLYSLKFDTQNSTVVGRLSSSSV